MPETEIAPHAPDYIDEAERLAHLVQCCGLSQEQAALRVGKSQSAVANKLRILRHSNAILTKLREHRLTERHARALLRLPTEAARLDALAVIAARGLNVAKTEQYIDSLLAKAACDAPPKAVRRFLRDLNASLSCLHTAGIRAVCSREETDAAITITVHITKNPL